MLAVIVNAVAVLVASFLGLGIGSRIPKSIQDAIMSVVPLCVLGIGISSALKGNTILIIVSMVAGTAVGTMLDIEGGLNALGKYLQQKLSHGNEESRFVEGFVGASLLYCVGSMAILGSLEAGISQKYDILFAKSVLDATSAVILATTYGIGVAFSAVAILLYQGAITLLSGALSALFSETVIANLSGVGGIMIIALALNMLKLREFKVGNMLPAVFGPIVVEILAKVLHIG